MRCVVWFVVACVPFFESYGEMRVLFPFTKGEPPGKRFSTNGDLLNYSDKKRQFSRKSKTEDARESMFSLPQIRKALCLADISMREPNIDCKMHDNGRMGVKSCTRQPTGVRSSVFGEQTTFYILKTPNWVGAGMGALLAAASDRPRTCLVWAGSMTPSSHKRALL